MRRYRMRFDVWLSFLLACGIAYLVGLGVDKITERTYEGYRESRLVEDGVVGGAATEDIYRITCIDDIKSHELFTLETESTTETRAAVISRRGFSTVWSCPPVSGSPCGSTTKTSFPTVIILPG